MDIIDRVFSSIEERTQQPLMDMLATMGDVPLKTHVEKSVPGLYLKHTDTHDGIKYRGKSFDVHGVANGKRDSLRVFSANNTMISYSSGFFGGPVGITHYMTRKALKGNRRFLNIAQAMQASLFEKCGVIDLFPGIHKGEILPGQGVAKNHLTLLEAALISEYNRILALGINHTVYSADWS